MKNFSILFVLFCGLLISCGPSKEEQAAIEKQRIEDSIKAEAENKALIEKANSLFESSSDSTVKKDSIKKKN